jgi:ribosome-associated protein
MTETTSTLNQKPTPDYTIEQLVDLAAEAADDRKAGDLVLIDISEVSTLADYLLIVSGYSKVQLKAIANSIVDKLEADLNRPPIRSEGQDRGGWILLDYGDLIVHIMLPEQREFYNLEAFWGHGTTVPLPNIEARNYGSNHNVYGNSSEQL